jgi:hypothetical protein
MEDESEWPCVLARHACKTPLHNDYSSINSELKRREQVLITILPLRFVVPNLGREFSK